MSADTTYHGDFAQLTVPLPSSRYVDHVLRLSCAPVLLSLYRRPHKPAKELTESYAALKHLRRSIDRAPAGTVMLHIGDGAHCRTGAMGAYLTRLQQVSIDPAINESVVKAWVNRWSVERLWWHKARAEDVLDRYAGVPTIVTFVHAHVDTDAILARLSWIAAFTLVCCKPREQLSKLDAVVEQGADMGVLSPQRRYQVLVREAG